VKRDTTAAGFSLIELLVSLTIFGIVTGLMASMLVQNSRVNKKQLLQIETQSSARTTLSLVVQILRTAGWDPRSIGFAPVILDSDLSDSINDITVQADLNADGDTDDTDEHMTIRQINGRVELQRTAGGSWETVGVNITNDADGDGTAEPMFTPDATPDPTRITVKVTATASSPNPENGAPIRYTLTTDVVLRNAG
jgi:prepilin-type N-terminal cleavage/methylation domain-containing protein